MQLCCHRLAPLVSEKFDLSSIRECDAHQHFVRAGAVAARVPLTRKAKAMQVNKPTPRHIAENQSDMRGIKPGWYAIEDDGNLSSGPFSSHEECVKRINQPTNETGASKLQRGPN